MPFLSIKTNLPVTRQTRANILKDTSAVVAHELEKPEEYVTIALEPNTAMLLAGSAEPMAFLELKSVALAARKTRPLSQLLCEVMKDHLGISQDRVYVKFIDERRRMWGWKGGAL